MRVLGVCEHGEPEIAQPGWAVQPFARLPTPLLTAPVFFLSSRVEPTYVVEDTPQEV